VGFSRSKIPRSSAETILKPRLAAARCQYVYVGFSRSKIPRSSAKFRSLYDIGESSLIPAGSILSVESNQNPKRKMWSPRLKNVESKIAFLLQEISYFEP